MLKFSIVEISQLLGSLDFFFFFSELQAKNGNFQLQHQGLLFCWLSCSARVICFSKTSRNAKVGLREHTHFLCRKEGMSLCCLQAVIRRGAGEVTCPAPSTWVWILLIVTTYQQLIVFDIFLMTAGWQVFCFFKKSLRWVGDAKRGKKPTFIEVYPPKYSASYFIYLI